MNDTAKRVDLIKAMEEATKHHLDIGDSPERDAQRAVVEYAAKHAMAGLFMGANSAHKAVLDALLVAFAAVPSTSPSRGILVGYTRGVTMLMLGRDALSEDAKPLYDDLIACPVTPHNE